MIKKPLLLTLSALPIIFASTMSFASPSIDQQQILANAPSLNPSALAYAVKGFEYASQHSTVGNSNVLTVIDFTKPSYAKRLWVIDLKTDQVLMNTYAAQGKNSGVVYATRFSNAPRSDETSLGVFKTANTYYGKHGLSERLEGLESGINNNAYSRAVVIHPAWYMSPSYIKANHRAGRSWGCFALNPAVSEQFIHLTQGGSVIFAYAAPEKSDSNLTSL